MRRARTGLILALVALAAADGPATACTGLRVRPKDGSVIAARTLEFAVDPKSDVVVIPRGRAYVGTAPGDRPGRAWTSRHGAVGANALGRPHLIDGLNEKGLGVGLFYFPGYAGYQDVSGAEAARALAPWELGTYLLTTCADVAEAVEAARGVLVGPAVVPEWGIVPPLHYVVHDAGGLCVVLEYVGGRLNVHDNPLGVVTNSPSFDWHVTNLRNYVNLSVTNVPPVDLGALKLAPLGQGSGMLGLPGDFTPPSRFVRAVAFSQSALPVASAREGVLQAFHLLNQFDIPRGSARGRDGGAAEADYTLWTSASDLTNRRFYFHTYANRRIRMVDLRRFDLDAPDVTVLPMSGEEAIEDLLPRGR